MIPADFLMVPESQFGLRHLRLHPVWARFYEPDDAKIVYSWGVDPVAFQNLLNSHHTGNDHAMFPVLRFDPLPDDLLELYVRAAFTAPRGEVLDGYIMADAHFICIYPTESTWFSFSLWGAMLESELDRYHSDGGQLPLFPLHFSTPYRLADGRELRGEFAPKG